MKAAANKIVLVVEAEHVHSIVQGSAKTFTAIRDRLGQPNILAHSVALCPADDLLGWVTDCSRDGFARIMHISVHSLIRMVRLAEPLMTKGARS